MTGLQQAIDAAFTTAARRWERILAVIRVVLCVVMAVRTALFWNFAPDAVGALLLRTALFTAGSIAVIRSSAPIERLLRISVVLDTTLVFVALLNNVLRPWPGYSGVVNTPEIAALAMATLGGGLRLSPRTAVFAAVLNAACFAVLLALDRWLHGLPLTGALHQYTLQGSFLVAAATMAIVIAVRTRGLVERAVRAALTAGRAQRSFGALLHEHHDVRTLLSAVRLHADRLAVERRGGGGTLEDLRSDLDDVETRINAIYARASGELSALDAKQRVDVSAVAREVVERLARRFSGPALALRGEPDLAAEVAGGDATMRRVLFNLVINACEGDGERGPSHVEVTVRGDRVARRVWIEVADDGPGFAREILDGAPDEIRSTKPGGSGFGLAVARALTQANDGTLTRGNRAAGGAWVLLSLPMVR